ncbi:MAG: hypothetical protein QXW47_10890 [Candidatus Jordarchaeales archaeon]
MREYYGRRLKRTLHRTPRKRQRIQVCCCRIPSLAEILKRMDKLEENMNRLWEEVRSLREGFAAVPE